MEGEGLDRTDTERRGDTRTYKMQANINFGQRVAISDMKMGRYYFAVGRGGSVSIGKRTRRPSGATAHSSTDYLKTLVFLKDVGSIFVNSFNHRLRSSPHKKPYDVQQYNEYNYTFYEVPAHVTATPNGFIDADLNVIE